MSESVVEKSVALAFVRRLSGAPGYPFHPEGELRVAEVLREVSVSVSHALAVVDEFDNNFPTIEEIRSVAYRLREKFDPNWCNPTTDIPRDLRAKGKSSREALLDIGMEKGLVPLLPNGKPDEVLWTAQSILLTIKNFDNPPKRDKDSVGFWAQSMKFYEDTEPTMVRWARAGKSAEEIAVALR